MKLKILLYVNSFLPDIGGRELVVHHLARELLRQGAKVRVVGPAGWWRLRRVKFEYPLHRWPTSRGLFRNHVRLLQLAIDTFIWGCDVIHAHNTYPTGYIAARLKSFKDVPLVITPHGEDIHVIGGISRGLRLSRVVNRKIRYSLNRADITTAISDDIERSLLNAGASKSKIRRIPNGVDIERFQGETSVDLRERLELPRKSRLIVTVGNYRLCKGHEIVIRAMPIILSQEPNVRLIIVGKNNEILNPLIHELGLQNKVRLTGSISVPIVERVRDGTESCKENADLLAATYLSSHVFVSAGIAEGAEGFSLAVLEAMASGLPVVGTDISGNRDIIQNGKNGILAQPNNPESLAEGVLQMLQNEKSRIRMGAKAREVAKKYSWCEIALKYLAVYEEARYYCRKG
jgi:glycosyltransferase involved in cell wall biosynthesis